MCFIRLMEESLYVRYAERGTWTQRTGETAILGKSFCKSINSIVLHIRKNIE